MAFTDEDKKRLRLYLTRCEEMANSSFIKNAPNELNLKVDFVEDKFTANWPEEESVKAFIVDFAPFYRKREPIFFPSICNLLSKNITDDRIKGEIAEVRKLWNKKLSETSILEYNNKRLTTEDILKTLLYGNYIHTDLDKRELLAEKVFALLLKHEFIWALYGLAKCVNDIGLIIRDVLDGKIRIDC